MKHNLYKRLEKLERLNALHALAREEETRRTAPPLGDELFQAVLSNGTERIPGESKAETVARAFGMSSWKFRDLLERP